MNDSKKRLARTTRPAGRRRDGAARPRPVDPELHLAPPFALLVLAEPAPPPSTAQPLSARTANPLGVRPVTERHPGDRFDT